MGKGGGKEADSCQNFGAFQMCFFGFSLYPSAFLADGTYILSHLPNLFMAPIHPFPVRGK